MLVRFDAVCLVAAIAVLGTAQPGHAGGRTSAGRASAAEGGAGARRVARRVVKPQKKAVLPESWRIGSFTYVSQDEYRDLRDGTMELLRRYPPDTHFFVGLGRDPAPIIAFLQNLGEKDLAVNLPGTSSTGWDRVVPDADAARYIEAAIPPAILTGKRTIVLVDVTSTGKTPAAFGPYLDRYLAARGNPKKSVRLAFSLMDVMNREHGPDLTDWIDIHPWPDIANYFKPGRKYEGDWSARYGGDGIAEHEWHQMARDKKPPRARNPNYTTFRKAVLARMQQDSALDAFLASRPATRPLMLGRPAASPGKARPRQSSTARSGATPTRRR
jgi:hypothetical protein